MANINTKTNKNPVKSNPPVLAMIKGLAIAYALTAAVFTAYAVLLTYADVSEAYIELVSLICALVCSALAGFDCACAVGAKGLIWGVGSGLLYAVILFAIAVLCGEGQSFSASSLGVIAIALAGGGIGGVLGVNKK